MKAVATRWASGRGDGPPADDAATQSAAAEIAAIEARRRGARPVSAPEIGPDEADAVTLFLSLSSQWRVHPMSGARLGIDNAAIGPTAAMLDITMSPRLFHDIRLMEGAALAAFPRP